MFSPTAMVGRALALAVTQTLRPAVTKAATQAGMGANGMRFAAMQSNLMINHGKLTNQLLQAVPNKRVVAIPSNGSSRSRLLFYPEQ